MVGKTVLSDDPNTFIPPAVRKASKRSEDLFHAQPGQPPQPPPEPPPEQTPPPQPQPQQPPSRPPEQTPPPPPAAAAQQPPPEQPPPVSEENWEHRYRSMEGRYNRAQNDIHAMSNQLASMQSLLASMQTKSQETPPELRPQSFLTPEEVNEYGQEFLGVVAKKAKEELSPEVMALKNELALLKKQFNGNAEQNQARARFELEATLDSRIPQWRDINVMPEFHAWLALPDMYSGAIRHELLRAAYAQSNTPRVLAFFKGFLDQEAAYVPPSGEPPPADDGKVPLASLAAPGRAKTAAATSAPAEKPIISRAQISAFYADSAAGKYRGREAEKARLEAMIFEAEREGRIR
jgi:hypothetical protein